MDFRMEAGQLAYLVRSIPSVWINSWISQWEKSGSSFSGKILTVGFASNHCSKGGREHNLLCYFMLALRVKKIPVQVP